MIIDDEYEEIVLDDFEDLMPPQWEKLPLESDADSINESITSSVSTVAIRRISTRNNKLMMKKQVVHEGKNEVSDCSSDVVIVEDSENSSFPAKQVKSSRVLRVRSTNIPNQPIKPSKIVKRKQSLQSKFTVIRLGRPPTRSIIEEKEGIQKHDTIQSKNYEYDNTKIEEAPFQRASLLPSTHDLIEAMATIGSAIVSSAYPIFPTIYSPDNIRHNNHQPKEKKETIIQHSHALFSRIKTRAANGGHTIKRPRKVLKLIAANYNLRHPFLFPWEKDEDRLACGEWRTRRDCYQALQTALEEQEKIMVDKSFSDAENEPQPLTLEPIKRADQKRRLTRPLKDFPPNQSDDFLKDLPTIEPYLLGYRWTSSSEQPEKMMLWR